MEPKVKHFHIACVKWSSNSEKEKETETERDGKRDREMSTKQKYELCMQ